MPIFVVVIWLVICTAGAALFFRLARKKQQKEFTFLGLLFSVLAVLFSIYLALAAIFLAGGAFER